MCSFLKKIWDIVIQHHVSFALNGIVPKWVIKEMICRIRKSLFNKTQICKKMFYPQVRSNPPDVFLGKGALKKSSKFTRENLCRSVILIKLLCNFFKITLQHACSPVNLLHIFRTLFPKNTSARLILTGRDKCL